MLDCLLNILCSPSGSTVAQLGEVSVARVSLGSLLFRMALGVAVATAVDIQASRPVTGKAPTYAEVQGLSLAKSKSTYGSARAR